MPSAKNTSSAHDDYFELPRIVVRTMRADNLARCWNEHGDDQKLVAFGYGAARIRHDRLAAVMAMVADMNPTAAPKRTAMDRPQVAALRNWFSVYTASLLLPEFDADEFLLVFKQVSRALSWNISKAQSERLLDRLLAAKIIRLKRNATKRSAAVYGIYRRPRSRRARNPGP